MWPIQVIQVSVTETQVRGAAHDAAARLRGHFGALPGGGQATMLEWCGKQMIKIYQWQFQDPRLEVPTIYRAYGKA